MKLSIVVPVYNEQKNIIPLYTELTETLFNYEYEIIFVDDGSRDFSFRIISEIKDDRVKVIKFRKNFGQTAAMDAGFKHATGDIIIPIDADMQNDPKDIPKMITKLNQGYDVVCGWRKNRKDSLGKRVISRVANLLRKLLVKDKIHDSGCTLKVIKKECFDDLDLFGEMHRFIPALLSWKGFRVTEIVVNHRSRKYGKTKYTFSRIVKGFLDMIVVAFWQKYSNRPMHLFGGLGIIMMGLGFLSGLYLAVMKIFFSQSLSNRPLLLLSILLLILGTQFFIFGLISDILIKMYYQRPRTNYKIEKVSQK